MICISKLDKVYKSKKRKTCKALDDVNLILPDGGLVFVLGKSGSGKSTLLNLIGGLDNITSGSIIVDGNDISSFKENEYCNYRNNHIGFIFQDYHLIDELTVYENICLSLNLKKQDDKEKVLLALEKVDLKGYENRFPTELSGGERQRVAIARAIVKKPRIILADEPTGNLDTVTSTQIIELLKALSKECLILIVSHNKNDAYKYGDRIIELSKGKIIKDESRNPEYVDEVVVNENIIYYPYDKVLTDQEINLINNNISNDTKIVKVDKKYVETNLKYNNEEKQKIEKKSLSIFHELLLSLKFLKNKVFSIVFSSFMVSVIMVILALSQTIITFDSGEIISNEMKENNQETLYIEKFLDQEQRESLEYDYYNEVTLEDIAKFKEKGFKDDEITEVLNYTIPISNSVKFAGWTKPLFSNSLYMQETLGTLIIDEDYLSKKLGKVEYISRLDEFHPCGLIITDYVADCILAASINKDKKTYNDLLGLYFYNNLKMYRGYINGIVKTGYKDKYQGLFDDFKKGIVTLSSASSDMRVINFTFEIYSSLGYSYTFNNNFANDLLNYDTYQSVWHYALSINGIPFYNHTAPQIWRGSTYKYDLKENEVIMNVEKYNEFFGTNYTSDNLDKFVPHEITLSQFMYFDLERKNPLFEKKLIIKGLEKFGSYSFYVSDDLYKTFKANLIYTKGLLLENNNSIGSVLELVNKLNFEHQSYIIEGIHTMTKAVDVFIPIFELIGIILCIGIIFILVNFSSKMIKDKMHEIGILKALGTQNKSIGTVFGLQICLIALLTIIMSTLGYFFFIDLANDVLIASLKELAPSHVVLDLDFLTFKFNVVLINVLLIIGLCLISLLVPLIKIKNIKPVKIIKAKE